ncbi:MAG: Crp/Fnr family transcriptional regulator [Limnohabitans sp.]
MANNFVLSALSAQSGRRLNSLGYSLGMNGLSASDREQVVAVLRAVPWLANVRDETLDLLAQSARLELHTAGAQVGRRGGVCTHLIVVIRGTVLVGFDMPDGRRHVINLLGPGQFQSLIPLIDERPQIHDIVCKSESMLLLIPRDVFVAALNGDQSLTWAMLRLLCDRARRIYGALGESHTLSLAPRLARVLRGLFAAHGQHITIAQEELADILGATRQSINRELKALETVGAIHLGRGRIDLVLAEQLHVQCDEF